MQSQWSHLFMGHLIMNGGKFLELEVLRLFSYTIAECIAQRCWNGCARLKNIMIQTKKGHSS